MKDRCLRPNCTAYEHYGGRGVKICKGWLVKEPKGQGFKNFLADLGPRPPAQTLDRMNVNGHYSCGHCGECELMGWIANCKWATQVEQHWNRRCNPEAYPLEQATLSLEDDPSGLLVS